MTDQPNNPPQPTIAEMNRDIAVFMGYEPTERNGEPAVIVNGYADYVRDWGYDNKYDKLMPVWLKFRDTDAWEHNEYYTYSHRNRKNRIEYAMMNEPITEAHRLIWEGVKWLETIKNK